MCIIVYLSIPQHPSIQLDQFSIPSPVCLDKNGPSVPYQALKAISSVWNVDNFPMRTSISRYLDMIFHYCYYRWFIDHFVPCLEMIFHDCPMCFPCFPLFSSWFLFHKDLHFLRRFPAPRSSPWARLCHLWWQIACHASSPGCRGSREKETELKTAWWNRNHGILWLSIQLGKKSSQLTNSYFSEG